MYVKQQVKVQSRSHIDGVYMTDRDEDHELFKAYFHGRIGSGDPDKVWGVDSIRSLAEDLNALATMMEAAETAENLVKDDE